MAGFQLMKSLSLKKYNYIEMKVKMYGENIWHNL